MATGPKPLTALCFFFFFGGGGGGGGGLKQPGALPQGLGCSGLERNFCKAKYDFFHYRYSYYS